MSALIAPPAPTLAGAIVIVAVVLFAVATFLSERH